MRACLVAPTKIIAGIGMSFGIDCIEAPGATGYYNSAFHNKATTICDALTAPLITTQTVSPAQAAPAEAAPAEAGSSTRTTDVTGISEGCRAQGSKRQLEAGVHDEGGGGVDEAGAAAAAATAAAAAAGSSAAGSSAAGTWQPASDFGFLHVKAVDDTGHDRR